jgi:transcriptional regulator with XRE-family HTH domain
MPSFDTSLLAQAHPLRAVLARNIIRLRQERKWSQEQLAFEAGLHRTFVAHVERHARNISLDNLEKIASAFGLEAYRLLVP